MNFEIDTIDTGSSVNILPVKFVRNFKDAETMLKTSKNADYKPLGETRVVIRNPKNKKNDNVNFIICHNDNTPILGLRASEQMGLISVAAENLWCSVSEVSESEVCKNSKSEVFNKVVGTYKGEHRLKIKKNAIPKTMPNHKVPVAMHQPLKDELERLVKLRVITQVDKPTEWVSQSVITLKKNGKVSLCLDPQELNKVLLREHYIMPTIDDILHDLRQSKVFTKVDLSSGYWHIKLDKYSSELTTF